MTASIADQFAGLALFLAGLIVGTLCPVTDLAPLRGADAGDVIWITATLAAVAANSWVLVRLRKIRRRCLAAEIPAPAVCHGSAPQGFGVWLTECGMLVDSQARGASFSVDWSKVTCQRCLDAHKEPAQ